MTNLHVSFAYKGTPCHFDLVRSSETNNPIEINGVQYAVVAAKKDSAIAHQVLSAIATDGSDTKLEGRLKHLQDVMDVSVTPIQQIGKRILGTSSWKQTEQANLPKMVGFVARTFWENKDRMDLSGLKGFLKKDNFEQALQAPTINAFLALFEGVSVDDLWNIRNYSQCQPLGYVKTEPYTITPQDLLDLKAYLDDIGFSGVVCLSDAKATYYVCPTGQESLENVPFCMHSITKVFTGVLALMTLKSPETSKLELADSAIATLKEPLQTHLKVPTLLQAMTHNAGFGDYLANYEAAVQAALEKGETPPVIKKAEDLLTYADTTLYPLNNGRYSNLSILLVGLAIEHQLGNRPFNEILQELILNPAKMRISDIKPDDGKYNAEDPCQGNVMGSPAGGYWTTCGDLLKFGNWLQEKCKEPQFLSLMEKYGREFYVKDDQEIHHNGCSASGSSFLSSFRESGVTIAVLSDQSNFMANRIYYTIREKLVEKKS